MHTTATIAPPITPANIGEKMAGDEREGVEVVGRELDVSNVNVEICESSGGEEVDVIVVDTVVDTKYILDDEVIMTAEYSVLERELVAGNVKVEMCGSG